MRNNSEHDRLLKDVLGEADYDAFRTGLYQRGLLAVRHRRRRRMQQRVFAGSACLALLIATPFLLKPTAPAPIAEPPAVAIIRSRPLEPEQIVRTGQPGLAPGSFEPVNTVSRPVPVETIPDGGLLDLFAGRPVALVATGPGSKQLLFLDPEDEQAFRGSAGFPDP